MVKIFKRERFSVFKAECAARRERSYKWMCCQGPHKPDGKLVLSEGVFYLDGEKFFESYGTNKEWKMWYQLYLILEDEDKFSVADMPARFKRSKKNWPKSKPSNPLPRRSMIARAALKVRRFRPKS